MYQVKPETIHRIEGHIERVMQKVGKGLRELVIYLSRVAAFGLFAALCAVPFYLIHDKTKVSFWYCIGAFGVYLLGVAQVMNRRF